MRAIALLKREWHASALAASHAQAAEADELFRRSMLLLLLKKYAGLTGLWSNLQSLR